jgi:hypothetical protein
VGTGCGIVTAECYGREEWARESSTVQPAEPTRAPLRTDRLYALSVSGCRPGVEMPQLVNKPRNRVVRVLLPGSPYRRGRIGYPAASA